MILARLPQEARLRLVAAFVAILAISLLHDLGLAAGLVCLVGLLAWRAGPIPWRRLLHVEAFLLLLFVTLPFSVPGRALAHLGPLTLSLEGVARAALIGAKVLASVLILSRLAADLEPARLGGVLRALHVPERLVRLFVMTVRYLGLLREEATRLHEAMRGRGFRPGSNRHSWRSYGNLLGMLLVRALDRAQRVEEAMAARGFVGRFPHPALSAPRRLDWARFAVLGLGAVMMVMVDRIWMS